MSQSVALFKVHELPEGWKLASVLSASTQIAQIGPVFFLVGKKFAPQTFTYVRAIYTILFIGAASCFLLSFFWNATATVFGKERSLGLYILNFSLAILGLTPTLFSSRLFLKRNIILYFMYYLFEIPKTERHLSHFYRTLAVISQKNT